MNKEMADALAQNEAFKKEILAELQQKNVLILRNMEAFARIMSIGVQDLAHAKAVAEAAFKEIGRATSKGPKNG